MQFSHRIRPLGIRWKTPQPSRTSAAAWLFPCAVLVAIGTLPVLSSGWVFGSEILQDETSDLSSQVRQLATMLDDPAATLSQRRAAEQKLIELGPDVLPLLPDVFSSSANSAVTRIRQELEKQAGVLALRGSRVSLAQGTSVNAALQELAAETGNRWGNRPESNERTSCDFDNELYWRVMDSTLDDAHWDIASFVRGDLRLPIIPRADGTTTRLGHALYYEAFRIELRQVEAVRDLKDPARSRLAIRLQAAWEPRLHPVKLTLPTQGWTLLDDQGQTHSVESAGESLTVPVTATIPHVEFDIRFDLPSAKAMRIEKLTGTIAGLIPANPQTVSFANLVRRERQSMRIAEAEVTLEKTLVDRSGHEFVISVRFDEAADALESHHRWVFNNALAAMTADGQFHQPVATRVESERQDGVAVRYRFAPDVPLEGTILRYTTPTAIVPYSIPVLFERIDLP